MPVLSIGTASSLVVGNNKSRKSITLRNDSSNDIYLGTSGSGITTSQYEYHLKAGDAVNFNELEDGELPKRSFYGIASASSSNLSVLEGLTVG